MFPVPRTTCFPESADTVGDRTVIFVIVLTVTIILVRFGCPPAMALTVALAALAAASNPKATLDPGRWACTIAAFGR